MCFLCRVLLTIHVWILGLHTPSARILFGLQSACCTPLPNRADTLHLSCTSRCLGDVLAAMSTFGGMVSPIIPTPSCVALSHLTVRSFLSPVTAVGCCDITRNPSCHRLQKLLSCNLHTINCRYRLACRPTQSLLFINRVPAQSRIRRARVIFARPSQLCPSGCTPASSSKQ